MASRVARTILDHLIDVKEDGSFRLDQAYFDYCTGLRMTNERFDQLFGWIAGVVVPYVALPECRGGLVVAL